MSSEGKLVKPVIDADGDHERVSTIARESFASVLIKTMGDDAFRQLSVIARKDIMIIEKAWNHFNLIGSSYLCGLIKNVLLSTRGVDGFNLTKVTDSLGNLALELNENRGAVNREDRI